MILKVDVHLVRFEEGGDYARLPFFDGTQQRQVLLTCIPHAVLATERPAALPPREAGQKRPAGTSCFAPNAAPSAQEVDTEQRSARCQRGASLLAEERTCVCPGCAAPFRGKRACRKGRA
jgi:hypothetical protein